MDGRVGVEQVAFPQYGLLTNPGTAELLEEALRSGVETVGGIDPAGFDRDPVRHLDIVFGLAAQYGARIDLHAGPGQVISPGVRHDGIHRLAHADTVVSGIPQRSLSRVNAAHPCGVSPRRSSRRRSG